MTGSIGDRDSHLIKKYYPSRVQSSSCLHFLAISLLSHPSFPSLYSNLTQATAAVYVIKDTKCEEGGRARRGSLLPCFIRHAESAIYRKKCPYGSGVERRTRNAKVHSSNLCGGNLYIFLFYFNFFYFSNLR